MLEGYEDETPHLTRINLIVGRTEAASVDLAGLHSIRGAMTYSESVLDRARESLAQIDDDTRQHISVYVVGSYGRLEAGPRVSDLEWLLAYDDSLVNPQEAGLFQATVTRQLAAIVGRNRLSIGKTFGHICRISDLSSNIGGIADTNQMLTYRMLVLSEGQPLERNRAHETALTRLAEAYGGTHTAGHRLLSLATEIARYWRTLRIDYKFKVDERRLPWAVRNFKLRACRRFWYFATAVHFVAYGPRIDYSHDALFDVETVRCFMAAMGGSPTRRLIDSTVKCGGEQSAQWAVLTTYDSILGELSDPGVRSHLDKLLYADRHSDPTYQEIRRKCKELHEQMADYVLALPSDARRQMIEMFLL